MLIHSVVVPFVVGVAVLIFLAWTLAGVFAFFEKGMTKAAMMMIFILFFGIWGIGQLSIVLIPKLAVIFGFWCR